MYESWERIKTMYPDTWVVLVDAVFEDHHHLHLLGGVVFCTAANQGEMYAMIPDDDERDFVCRHTSEGVEEDGLLKSDMRKAW